jgi:hypothetical protein
MAHPCQPGGLPGLNPAEFAISGADIAKDHEGCRSLAPAFSYIGTVSTGADGMEMYSLLRFFTLNIYNPWVTSSSAIAGSLFVFSIVTICLLSCGCLQIIKIHQIILIFIYKIVNC